MTQQTSHPPDALDRPRSRHCPYLGLRADPTSIFVEPTEEHRCHVDKRPQPIGLGHQARFCLAPAFESCPRFVTQPARPAEAPSVVNPVSGLEAPVEESYAPPAGIFAWLARYLETNSLTELMLWLALMAFALVTAFWYLVRPIPGATSPADNAVVEVQPTPSPPAALAETPALPVVPATAVPDVATATLAPPTATLPPGRLLALLTPANNAVGWVSSGDRLNHFGDRNLHVGIFEEHVYHGAMQFSLASIPPGSRIEQVTLELVGLNAENLGEGGTWTLRLLSSEVDENWSSATYDQIHDAPVVDTIPPELGPQDLAARRVNVFSFTSAQRAELERRLETGTVSFRIDGPNEGPNNLFTWDTGYGGGFGNRPVLRVVYLPPPTLTPLVVTATPTPANVVTVAALAATATYQATAVGTATPWPPNVVTATPPHIIVNTPTPGNAATAQWVAAVATARAFLYGTPTPLPDYVWTATPAPPPTSPPLLIPVGQITPVSTKTPTPTPIATPTPSGMPAILKGRIAFLSDRLDEPAVFVVNPDGTNIALLTDRWAYDRALELDSTSPDGSQIAIVETIAGRVLPYILRVSLADGMRTPLTPDQRSYDPAWSPTGEWIAYVGQTPDASEEIFVVRPDGTQRTRLTFTADAWEKQPSWSPDGRRIAFLSNRDSDRAQIWVMNADGSDQHPLLVDEWNKWDLVWIK